MYNQKELDTMYHMKKGSKVRYARDAQHKEELEQQGHMMVKQLKNRYSDPTRNKRFMIGVDRAKMKLFDLDENAQNLVDSGQVQDDQPVFDRGNFGSRLNLSDIKV